MSAHIAKFKSLETPVITLTAFSSQGMVGMFHTILGTALPAIRISFEIDVAQAGLVGLSVWLGFTVAVFTGGALSDIFKRTRVLMSACLLMGCSAITVGMWRSFSVNCLLLGAVGAGTGMIVSSSSALVVVLYPRKEGMILSFHHFCYALGAIFGPLVMGYVLKTGWDWRWVYRAGGISMLVLGGIFLFTPREHKENKRAWDFGSFFHMLKEKNLIFLALIILLAAGTQNGLYFWLVSFLKEIRSFPILLAGLGLSLFSVGLAVGRFLSVWVSVWLGNTRLLSIVLITLNVAIFLLLHIAQNKFILAICFMAGLGCSGIAPIVLALGGVNFPHLLGTTMGILSAAAGIGSTFMPWIMSMASQRASLKAGLFTCQLVALFAFGVLMLFFKRLRDSERIW